MSEPVRIVAAPGTPAQLLSTIDAALKRFAEKHWAQVAADMKSKGFDTGAGCLLVLPQAQQEKVPGHRPDWVRFSPLIKDPVAVNPVRAGIA